MIPLLVIIANLADLLTFLCAMTILPASAELNPAARWIYGSYGAVGAIAYKSLGAAAIIAGLQLLPEGLVFWLLALAIFIPILGATLNTLAVLTAR